MGHVRMGSPIRPPPPGHADLAISSFFCASLTTLAWANPTPIKQIPPSSLPPAAKCPAPSQSIHQPPHLALLRSFQRNGGHGRSTHSIIQLPTILAFFSRVREWSRALSAQQKSLKRKFLRDQMRKPPSGTSVNTRKEFFRTKTGTLRFNASSRARKKESSCI